MYIFLIFKNTNSSLLGRFRSFFGEITKHINKIILIFVTVLVCCCIVFVHICCNAYMLLTRLLPEHAWRQTLMSIWNNLLAAKKLFRQLVNVIEVGGFYENDTFYTKLSLSLKRSVKERQHKILIRALWRLCIIIGCLF